jgi:hypothetical protein
MTLDLDAIRARADAASPYPWLAATDNGRKNGIGIVGQLSKRGTGQAIAVFAEPNSTQRNADAEFTAHAREDIPALIAEVERLRREHEPHRGSDVEAWIKWQRDRHPKGSDWSHGWYVLDDLLDSYREHSDTGTSLSETVIGPRSEEA